jgi:ABC-2 type transport system ATP-binding protein
MNILTAKNLGKAYGSNQAVDDLTFELAPGEFLGFLGPNGAGKTTTIRMLTGMLPPDRGEISIAGFSNGSRIEIARVIGVMPESRGFYEWMTAKEYLRYFTQLYDINNPDKTITELLDKVGLIGRKDSMIGAYSRGMKQRLALARALVNDPKILFLDEPTLGLDPQGQEDIKQLLRDMNRNGVTIFFSSHLLDEVAALCSRFIIINRGKMAATGAIADLQRQAQNPEGSLKDLFLHLTKNQ